MGDRKIIELEQGWEGMKVGISKLKDILEGSTEQKFVSEEYINLYTYTPALLPLLPSKAVVEG
jgi:hypothetical protein